MNATSWSIGLLLLGAFVFQSSASESTWRNAPTEDGDWSACLRECKSEDMTPSSHALCSAQVILAAELMEEGNWEGAQRESQRALLQAPNNPVARLIGLVASVRLAHDLPATLQGLEDLANHASSSSVRTMAAYEAGRILIASGDWSRAYEWLKQVFLNTSTSTLFLKSGCTLSLLVQKRPELGPSNLSLKMQLFSCETLWDARLRQKCALSPPPQRMEIFAMPGKAIVAFYKSYISPAIGARCSIEPSCSRYFLEASHTHGLMAFPILADRLVREPSVVAAARQTVFIEKRRRIADPLNAHDFWMTSKQ